jgi:hypothetical protein
MPKISDMLSCGEGSRGELSTQSKARDTVWSPRKSTIHSSHAVRQEVTTQVMADLSSNPSSTQLRALPRTGFGGSGLYSVGRYYLARGVGDGTAIQPYRFVMGGGGWNTGLGDLLA